MIKDDDFNPDENIWESKFMIGETVHIDGDSTSKYAVTAVLFRLNTMPQYEVSWMTHDGQKTAWIEQIRMERVTQRSRDTGGY